MKRLLSVAAVIFCTLSANAAFLQGVKPLRNRYIVTLKPDVLPTNVDDIAKGLAHAHSGRLLATMKHAMLGFGVSMGEAEARALSNNPLVALVEEDEEVQLSDAPILDVSMPPRQTYPQSAMQTSLRPQPLVNKLPMERRWLLSLHVR